eukprot:COSAG04_NODE_1609_length_6174_cov_10.786864_3_plen_320_part_00
MSCPPADSSCLSRERPKSVTLHVTSSPEPGRAVRSTFGLLRSRCRMGWSPPSADLQGQQTTLPQHQQHQPPGHDEDQVGKGMTMQREGKRRGEGCALREGVEVVHAARHVESRLQLLRAVRPPALHIQLLVQRIARPAQAQEIQAPANDMSPRLGGPSDHSEQGRSISECGVAHSSSWTRTSSGLSAYPSSCTRFGWLRSPVRNGHIAGTLASMQPDAGNIVAAVQQTSISCTKSFVTSTTFALSASSERVEEREPVVRCGSLMTFSATSCSRHVACGRGLGQMEEQQEQQERRQHQQRQQHQHQEHQQEQEQDQVRTR